MAPEQRQALHTAVSALQRAVEEMSYELALLRNALYVPAKPGDFIYERKTK